MRLENPLQIRLSTGIKRDKNGRTDSRDIAPYAFPYRDRAKCYPLPVTGLKPLEPLPSFRERLLQNGCPLSVSSKEIRPVIQRDRTACYIYERSKRDTERINREIKDIESKLTELIKSPDSINENYTLISSLKGMAVINTAAIPVATQNFTRFTLAGNLPVMQV